MKGGMDYRWPAAVSVSFVVTLMASGGDLMQPMFQIEVAIWAIVYAGCLGAFRS